MKKILIILIMLSLALYSCTNSFGGFDPRRYNSKTSISEDKEEDGGGAVIDPNDDPFQDHTNPNVNFDADKFKSWSFRVLDINKDNVPSYAFESDKTWGALDPFKGEYSHFGSDIGSGIKKINTVVYYKYESKNPRYGHDSGYNTGPHGKRMERFYFYRFTGKASAGPPLNNYVIAIDTYTKLVFAYAVPTESKEVMPGFPAVPTAWGSVDKETIGPGGKNYSFYEYDPVGIVSADGSVEIYKWFYNILASDKYDPVIAGYSEVATYKKPGKSPYLSDSAGGNIDLFLDYTKDKTFSLRDTDPNTTENSLIIKTYAFSANGKTVIYKTQKWLDNTFVEVDTFVDYKKIDNFSGQYGTDIFELRDNKTKLYINNIYAGTIDYSEEPLFLDRVKGVSFIRGETEFKFSSDGTTLQFKKSGYFSGSGTYKFIKNGDTRGRGIYELQGRVTGIGKNPWYGIELIEKDSKIWRTTGIWNSNWPPFGGAADGEADRQ